MKVPSYYYEQDIEPDNEYIHINDHYLALSEIEYDFELLIDELYDECKNYDKDVVHHIIENICSKLQMKKPNFEKIKL
ncbi:MAG: hypothetical protein PQJ44_07015 [Sphaerochaetaceae bacterium]|nr:hypothetical protein [Sphaerochaetaceae bacterium]